mgnify:CR=1 FL=1
MPTRKEVADCIITNLDIRGIDLENYRDKFEEENFLNALFELFGVEIPEKKIEEPTIPVTYGMIKNTVGWSKFCDETLHNHYTINEFGDYDLTHIFHITKTQYEKLYG